MATKKVNKKASKKKPVKKKSPKKKVSKRPAAKAKKKTKPKKKASLPKAKQGQALPPPEVEGTLLGRVEDFFAHINVIALTLKSSLSVGNTIRIKGHTTDATETVTSIQIEHESLQTAKKGDSVGIKISGVARKRDWVFRLG
jgi:putative protease